MSVATASAPVLVPAVTHRRSFLGIQPGEALTALLLAADVFLLLLGYYLVKVAREPLILLGGGAEVKSYAAAGQAALAVLGALAISALARRVNRVRLVAGASLFFAVNLVGFAALAARGVRIGVPFYLWVGVFNLSSVAQFWGFAAALSDAERGTRLFPILGVGSSLGAVAGSAVARKLMHIGPSALMRVAAAVLVACPTRAVAVPRRVAARGARGRAEAPIGSTPGHRLVLGDRYLILIALLVLVLNWVNASGEYILDSRLLAAAAGHAAPGAFVGAFKAGYFAWTNALGLTAQVFLVGPLLRRVGVRRALFIMPLVSLAGYGAMAAIPALTLALVAKVAENSLDYSLQNTSRQALWLVTSREAKHKAKQWIDAFVTRAATR